MLPFSGWAALKQIGGLIQEYTHHYTTVEAAY